MIYANPQLDIPLTCPRSRFTRLDGDRGQWGRSAAVRTSVGEKAWGHWTGLHTHICRQSQARKCACMERQPPRANVDASKRIRSRSRLHANYQRCSWLQVGCILDSWCCAVSLCRLGSSCTETEFKLQVRLYPLLRCFSLQIPWLLYCSPQSV